MSTGKLPPKNGSWRYQLGSNAFPIERDRYHLYVGLFCPFASRVIITRQLKGLHDVLPMDTVRPFPKDDNGWHFPADNDEYPGATVDSLYHLNYLNEIYRKVDPNYSGRFSVPVLWDKKREQIVNNESEDIMRMLNTVFNDFLPEKAPQRKLNFYRPEQQGKIDEINAWMMPDLNTGVYKAGFAQTQEDYDKHCKVVFKTLDRLEAMLDDYKSLYILPGDEMTEIDIKLFTTLIRFDVIYRQHFKLMNGSIRHDYPRLNRWLKNMYYNTGIQETVNFKHIKENYSKVMPEINPNGITPQGPIPDIQPWTDGDEKWKKETQQSKL